MLSINRNLLIGLMFIGCNISPEVKVSKVKLETLTNDTSKIKSMDYSNMTFEEAFSAWTNEIIKTEKPEHSIIAYKFGIFETPDVPSGYYLYLIGAKQYDPDDDDWAAGFGDFKPKNTYLTLPEKGFKDLKWDKVQKLVEKTVKKFTKSDDFKNSFFNDAKAIAVGFDGGDLVRVK